MKTIKDPEGLTIEEKIELLKSGNFNIYIEDQRKHRSL